MTNQVVTISSLIQKLGVEMYGDSFSIEDERIRSVYKKIYNLFSGKNKKKGALIIGSIGVGKSAMMKIYQRILKDTDRKFKWVNAYELKDLSEQITVGEIKSLYGYDLKCDLYIDDIGLSPDVRRYGNTVNIITEIIMERYDLFVSSGIKTHFSSNVITDVNDEKENNIPTLKKLYGKRVLDRMKEMCELITWNGNSLRK